LTDSPSFLLTILAFILVLGPLIFVHEMGHYLVARWCGVDVEAFSIGFGREIAHWTDRRGTRWRIGALPLGGYVRFAGDMNPASLGDPGWVELPAELRNRRFLAKPIWQRAAIVAAGPLVNLLFAVLILAGFALAHGENVTPATVSGVQPGSAAQAAGIRAGETITAIDGRAVERFEDISRAVHVRPGEPVRVTLRRGDAERIVTVTLGTRIEQDRFGNQYRFGQLGVRSGLPVVRPVSIVEAPAVALRQTQAIIGMMVEGLGQVISGRRPLSDLGGPLKIAQISGEQAHRGIESLIAFMALMSINLGFINLLPIPVLDGGHLLFYGIEAVARRPVSARAQEWGYRSGLALLLGLLLVVTFNDLSSFGVWEGLSGLIG
jgi:regulator of sigma E protease